MILLNKPYLPSGRKYQKYIEDIQQRAWLTNNGPMVKELKARLEDYLGVKHLLPVANGTLAIQIAAKALDVKGKAVTTPFTFVATSSALKWDGIEPVYGDIDPSSLNLTPANASRLIDKKTTAVVPVHVYGNPCDIHGFNQLAEEHDVKIIYDAAHAFGIEYQGKSVLNYGDASTLSFHATKVFHSVEGGAIIFNDQNAYDRACKMINFGIDTSTGNIVEQGINAKMSEVHAAMGLAVLDDMDIILEKRKALFYDYQSALGDIVEFPLWQSETNQNGAYMPVIFPDAKTCEQAHRALQQQEILTRRYFSPSLPQTDVYASEQNNTPVADEIAGKILCLPLYYDLTREELKSVTQALRKTLAGLTEDALITLPEIDRDSYKQPLAESLLK